MDQNYKSASEQLASYIKAKVAAAKASAEAGDSFMHMHFKITSLLVQFLMLPRKVAKETKGGKKQDMLLFVLEQTGFTIDGSDNEKAVGVGKFEHFHARFVRERLDVEESYPDLLRRLCDGLDTRGITQVTAPSTTFTFIMRWFLIRVA